MLNIRQPHEQPACFPLQTLVVASLLVAGCDDYEEPPLDAYAVDDEAVGDEELGGSDGEGEPELEAWAPDAEPWDIPADWVGGWGGLVHYYDCFYQGGDTTAIGVAAAPTPDGSHVRQLALVCAPKLSIENATSAPTSEQVVIYSGYAGFGQYVLPGWTDRASWDASGGPGSPQRIQAPDTRYALCDPGYRLSEIDVRAATSVDRIKGVTCVWDALSAPPGYVWSYWADFEGGGGVGGWGGIDRTSSCQSAGLPFADGVRFHSSPTTLIGFGLNCDW